MSREFPKQPIAAVGAVVLKEDAVVLIRRGQEPGLGRWSIPGGAVWLGEPLEQALRREVQEETGLLVRPLSVIKVVERILPQGDRIQYHYIIIDYACTVEGGGLEAGSDAAEARWVPWGELKHLGLPKDTVAVIELARQVWNEAEAHASSEDVSRSSRSS